MNKLVLLALLILFIFLASVNAEPIHIIWLDKLIGWFIYDGWPTIYFWLALIFAAIAADNFSSYNQRRKEKKQKAEKYYQKLDQEKAEDLAEAKRKEKEIEAKRKKEKEEAKLKAAEAKRKREEEAKLKAAEAKLKREEAEEKRKQMETKALADAKIKKDEEVKRKKELAASKAAELKRKKEEIKARLSEQKEKTEGAYIRATEIKRNKENEEAEIKEKSTLDLEQKIENIADFEDLYISRTSDKWMELTKSAIDGSDAAFIMELDSSLSIDDLLFTKIRQNQKNVKSTILKEQSLKPEARTAYISKTGLEFDPICIKHNKFPWLIASIDGISSDLQSIVEYDCSASSYWKARNNKVSDAKYAKLQHLMMVSGAKSIDYWCYWSGREGILQKINRNNSYIDLLFKSELEFIDNLI